MPTMGQIRHYVEGRLTEWVNSLSFVILACSLFIWPEVTKAPAFHFFVWALPHQFIGVVLLLCGGLCIIALIVNGSSHSLGPRVRAWTALLRSALLFQFWLSTVQAGVEQGYPYTVTPFWLMYALGEIWIAYRAVLDVRTPR